MYRYIQNREMVSCRKNLTASCSTIPLEQAVEDSLQGL
jgi:hypothetical protein